MKIKKLILFFNLLLLKFLKISFLIAHPVHVTITNVNFDESKLLFEIRIKIFSDDFENAILKKTGINVGLTSLTVNKNTEKYMIMYISENFNLYINDRKKPLITEKTKFKYEIKEDATWIDISFNVKEKVKKIKIYNNLLNNLYDDMKNMLIINWKNQEKGIIFAKNKVTEILE
ncbi:MAG: hypothetical protein N3A01_09865 [Bacteroidales bacterium]|nr:hypothetical protein [Bacteroidales bacterium]